MVPLNSWQKKKNNTFTNHGLSLNFTVLPKAPSIRWSNFSGAKGKGGRTGRQSKQEKKLENADESLCVLKEWGHAFFPMNSYLPFYYEPRHTFYLGLFCLGVRDICSCDHTPPMETNILSINIRHCMLWSRYSQCCSAVALDLKGTILFSPLFSAWILFSCQHDGGMKGLAVVLNSPSCSKIFDIYLIYSMLNFCQMYCLCSLVLQATWSKSVCTLILRS